MTFTLYPSLIARTCPTCILVPSRYQMELKAGRLTLVSVSVRISRSTLAHIRKQHVSHYEPEIMPEIDLFNLVCSNAKALPVF